MSRHNNVCHSHLTDRTMCTTANDKHDNVWHSQLPDRFTNTKMSARANWKRTVFLSHWLWVTPIHSYYLRSIFRGLYFCKAVIFLSHSPSTVKLIFVLLESNPQIVIYLQSCSLALNFPLSFSFFYLPFLRHVLSVLLSLFVPLPVLWRLVHHLVRVTVPPKCSTHEYRICDKSKIRTYH